MQVAAGLGAVAASTGKLQAMPFVPPRAERLPREVWVGTVSLEKLEASSADEMNTKVLNRMEEIAPYQPDIVCTPEIFPYIKIRGKPNLSVIAENGLGPIGERFADYAKRHQCYVICSHYTEENGHVYNSAVLIDRHGQYVGEYRKTYTTDDETEAGVMPGPIDPPVFQTDFGTIGIQICFDVNWSEGWRRLGEKGAEIVFWPSAFAGGRMTNAMAWQYHYNVVTSCRQDPTKVCDMTGEEVASTGRYGQSICAPLNLEKAFVHSWPYIRVYPELRKKYGRAVAIHINHDEGWSVIESRSPDVKITDVLREFNIKTHKEHIQYADKIQRKYRI